jgi:hypothetical protein
MITVEMSLKGMNVCEVDTGSSSRQVGSGGQRKCWKSEGKEKPRVVDSCKPRDGRGVTDSERSARLYEGGGRNERDGRDGRDGGRLGEQGMPV